MNRLQAIPVVFRIGFVVMLLLYAAIINTELAMGSQQYTLTMAAKPPNIAAINQQCLGKLEAITEQMRLEKMPDNPPVLREKMHVFTKWYYCGVF